MGGHTHQAGAEGIPRTFLFELEKNVSPLETAWNRRVTVDTPPGVNTSEKAGGRRNRHDMSSPVKRPLVELIPYE